MKSVAAAAAAACRGGSQATEAAAFGRGRWDSVEELGCAGAAAGGRGCELKVLGVADVCCTLP
eukprot:1153844-Pelagomonas_calceolata.AAC.3